MNPRADEESGKEEQDPGEEEKRSECGVDRAAPSSFNGKIHPVDTELKRARHKFALNDVHCDMAVTRELAIEKKDYEQDIQSPRPAKHFFRAGREPMSGAPS